VSVVNYLILYCVPASRRRNRNDFVSHLLRPSTGQFEGVMASPKRRTEQDVLKLLMSDYDVSLCSGKMSEFYVKFKGPPETPFEKGVWKIRVELPEQFPYKSPSIGFQNKIFHPNIDELSGSVCLDVINQTWSPMFELINIFEIFLPQLLRYPNAADPLNGEAASLLMRDQAAYDKKVRSYVERYAKPEDAEYAGQDDEDEDTPASPTIRSKGKQPAGKLSGNGTSANSAAANGHSKGPNGAEDEDDEDENMSDMGELSDGDDFMGDMDD